MSTPASTNFRRRTEILTPGRGAVIYTVSWTLLVLAIATLVARFAVKLSRRTHRKILTQDDVLLVLAAVFSFGQTIAVSIQWKDTPDERHLDPSNDSSVYQKAVYVSSIFFIANMGCAKICLSLAMGKLFTGRLFEYTSVVLAIFTTVWTFSGVVVTVFQCRMPVPWNVLSSECIDSVAFGNYLASTNIATEVLLVLVPLVVWSQDASVGNRLYVSAVFWSRLSIVAAVSVQLYFFNASVTSATLVESWAMTLCMQMAQTLSVISACLLGLHPLVAKDMDDTSINIEKDDPGHQWDTVKFGSLSSSHTQQLSVDSNGTFTPVISPYCHPLATHGLVRSSASNDSYNFPRILPNTALPLSTPEPPVNVFNRLIRSSSSLDLDPLGTPRNIEQLGCLPAPDWDDDEVEETTEPGRTNPERRPASKYVFQRSKVISVPEERNMFEIGKEWNGFVPPLPTPTILMNPPRAF